MEYVNENYAKRRQLEQRTLNFAVASLQFLDTLPQTNSSRIICFQLGKSASSIGANYREANGAESRADFAHKIGIVLKEAMETQYWLQLLDGLYPGNAKVGDLSAECAEFVRMFQKASNTLHKEQSGK